MSANNYDFGEVDDSTRAVMEANPPEGTEPESVAADALDRLGVGYDEQPSYGRYRPDFRLEDGTVLQIMGCWWHGCPCAHDMSEVGTNADYWSEKQEANRERDKRRRTELLGEHGAPYVFWVWEHEDIADRVAALCERRGLV